MEPIGDDRWVGFFCSRHERSMNIREQVGPEEVWLFTEIGAPIWAAEVARELGL
jgi:hypothetical protein